MISAGKRSRNTTRCALSRLEAQLAKRCPPASPESLPTLEPLFRAMAGAGFGFTEDADFAAALRRRIGALHEVGVVREPLAA